MRKTNILSLSLLILLSSCNNPKKYYDQIIQDAGYIAYETPVSDTLPGALFATSTPDNLIFAGMHDECYLVPYLQRQLQIT